MWTSVRGSVIVPTKFVEKRDVQVGDNAMCQVQ